MIRKGVKQTVKLSPVVLYFIERWWYRTGLFLLYVPLNVCYILYVVNRRFAGLKPDLSRT